LEPEKVGQTASTFIEVNNKDTTVLFNTNCKQPPVFISNSHVKITVPNEATKAQTHQTELVRSLPLPNFGVLTTNEEEIGNAEKLLLNSNPVTGGIWKSLALHFGFSDKDIQEFLAIHKDEIPSELSILLIEKWHEKMTDRATKKVLAQALWKAGAEDLAKQI